MEIQTQTPISELDSPLVNMCISAATKSQDAVNRWRLQRRSLNRLPSPLASALLHRLLLRRLLFPSLLEVFKFSVEEIDLKGENSVDAEWMAYIGAFSYLRSLNVANCFRINNSALWPLSGLTSLKELDLSRCTKVGDAGVRHLLSITTLEKLSLSETGVTVDGIKLLASLVNLSSLDLGGLPVSDQALSSLGVLTKLEYLDLWGSNVSDEGALIFKKFLNLAFLNLSWTNLTVLPNLTSLRCLNMSNCSVCSVMEDEGVRVSLSKIIAHGTIFKDDGRVFSSIDTSCLHFLNLSNACLSDFGFLHNMTKLGHLDLSGCTIQDDAVEAMACIGANLRYLNLNHTKVSSGGVEVLAGHLPNLEVLSLSCTSIDDLTIAYLTTMPSLKEVNLSKTNITGRTRFLGNDDSEILSLKSLQDLNFLKSLDLGGTRVTDASLQGLLSLRELSYLSLDNTPITDNCLDHLSQVTKLKKLNLQGALLTNAALDSFKPPVTLEVLDLQGCWLLTRNSLTSFCESNPGIKVRHDSLSLTLEDHVDSYHPGRAGSSGKGSNSLKPKEKHGRPSTPVMFRMDVLDQRIKYSVEELLSLQHVLPLAPANIDPEVLKVD